MLVCEAVTAPQWAAGTLSGWESHNHLDCLCLMGGPPRPPTTWGAVVQEGGVQVWSHTG